MTIDKKKFVKGITVVDETDPSIKISLENDPSATGETIIKTSASSSGGTLTLPDNGNDTLVGASTPETLLSKTIDADQNSLSNISNTNIKAAAGIDASKISSGLISNTEFDYLNGVTSNIQTQLTAKENSANKGVANGYASLDANGLVPTTQMPPAALERLVTVADQTARFALTTSTVQNGDSVYQNDTQTMYFVKDDTNLSNSSGYQVYSAGTAVNFSGALSGDISGTQGATTYNGIVPVSKGGTNSSTALTNGKVMISSAGSIVESSTITTTELGLLDGVTGVLVTEAGTQTLTNKTLTSPSLTTPSTDVVTLDGQASTPASPSSGFYKMYVSDTTQKLTVLNSAGVATTVGSGSGISNYLATENDGSAIGDFTTYADAAATSPVDGTGGSPTVTFATQANTSINGSNNFIFTHAASNQQGQGFSVLKSIDAGDRGKVLRLSFDYKIATGTYADNDLTIWFYDATNAALIQGAPYQIKNSGIVERFYSEVQIPSSCASLRIIFHVATSTATAYTMLFDNFVFGQQAKMYGSPITDWVSFTPTITATTTNPTMGTAASDNKYQWRRVGDSMEVHYSFRQTTAGTAGSGDYQFPIPSGYTIDTTKTNPGSTVSGNTKAVCGSAIMTGGGANPILIGNVQAISSTQVGVYWGSDAIATNGWGSADSANFGTGSLEFSLSFKVPILGWSSSQIMSSDADTRVVAASYTRVTNQTINTTNTDLIWSNLTASSLDTHAMMNTLTGVVTFLTPGEYKMSLVLRVDTGGSAATQHVLSTSSTGSGLIPNGIVLVAATDLAASKAYNYYPSLLFKARAGDTLKVVMSSATNSSTLIGDQSFFNLEKISGSAQIAASESVSALYTGAPPTGTLTNSYNTTTFGTKVKDSHNAYSSGTYIVPISGVYDITARTKQAATYSLGKYTAISIFIDGVQKYTGTIEAAGAIALQFPEVNVRSVPLLAGQLVTIRCYNDATTPTFSSNADQNYFSIVRTGNY